MTPSSRSAADAAPPPDRPLDEGAAPLDAPGAAGIAAQVAGAASAARVALPPEGWLDDVPAAHSMDTTWFAVDLDGHVGQFLSGEEGPVPVGGERSNVDTEALPQVEVVHVRDSQPGLACTVPGQTSPHVRLARGMAGLVWPASLKDVRRWLDEGFAVEVAGEPSPVVLVPRVDPDRLRALHDRGRCVVCRQADPLVDASRGLYAYEHLCENWVAGPYGLLQRPAKPLRVSELPAAEAASLIRLPVRFATASIVQPARYVPCGVWGESSAACLDEDGVTIRPVLGMEEFFEEAAELLRSEFAEAFEQGKFVLKI